MVRVNKSSTRLANSRPCWHCLVMMNTLAPKKGYRIRKIYYSDTDGNIIKSSLQQLLDEERYISYGNRQIKTSCTETSYKQNKNNNKKLKR